MWEIGKTYKTRGGLTTVRIVAKEQTSDGFELCGFAITPGDDETPEEREFLCWRANGRFRKLDTSGLDLTTTEA